MDYVIGDAIRKKVEEKGMTFVSFADKFGITDRNLQYVFKKSDLSIQQVVRASEILEYDFLTEYLMHKKSKFRFQNFIPQQNDRDSRGKSERITMTFNISGAIETYSEKFPELLKNVSMEAKKLGFEIA
ncbi:hypothetical protein [Pedobacter ginsengisoli]|uniref:hypothetical protein n=1 Tax=Pedobacter ginsengisoli TaxID=363852 RepID=UPI0025510596|nr:hypothetical protein [Pedobacter ginsengisoli]